MRVTLLATVRTDNSGMMGSLLSAESRIDRPAKRLRVLMTREEIVPDRLAGATAVVFDVFLATTTLLTILEHGARSVYPVPSEN